MRGALDVLFVVMASLVAAFVVWTLARAVVRLRGTRLVTCPETKRPAAVEVDLRYALVGAALGRPQLRLRDCSRWPERGHCGQPCLSELEAAPQECLVRNVLAGWYATEKQCVFCQRPFGDIHWHDLKPALRAPDGTIREWRDFAPETLPDVLATHQPVCASCATVEWMRREHPELIVERPPRPQPRHHAA